MIEVYTVHNVPGQAACSTVDAHSNWSAVPAGVIQTKVDKDAITVSWQVPRHNDVGGAHILHRHSIKSIPVLGEGGGRG